MAELKTKPNDASVDAYLQSIADERKQRDSYAIMQMMQEVTGEPAQMWGSSIIGFWRLSVHPMPAGVMAIGFLAGSPRVSRT